MSNSQIVTQFYTAFAKGNAQQMLQHYAEEVTFYDPAFGQLTHQQPHAMWKMLTSRFTNETTIEFTLLEEKDNTVIVAWTAHYQFGPTKQWVTNRVTSTLQLKNGKIFHHRDDFNLWKWSIQALGLPGFLLGWTPFMQKKIQQNTNSLLQKYIAKKG